MGRWRSNYGYGGGYDSTGRWRSEAWHMDGGANDEGWHYRYCAICARKTEHGRQSTGAFCVECDNRAIQRRARMNKNPHKINRNWVLLQYEEKAGSLPNFLQSLKEQNQKRALSKKQLEIGKKVLLKHLDENTLKTFWICG
tara:strand:+ start:289 stop:711 length:423 start_codon:yes stop_codon:yes gene_type:complete